MPITDRHRPRWILTGLVGALVLLAGCDVVKDRAERAGEVTQAAVEQVAGSQAGDAGPTRMEDVPVDARAFAGQIIAQPEF